MPIPTYDGDEICRVNGIGCAGQVVLATLGSRLHGMNLLYDRRFDVAEEGNRRYTLKLGSDSSHQRAIDAVPYPVTLAQPGKTVC